MDDNTSFQGCFPAVPVTPTTIAPVLFLQHVASFPKALTVSSTTKTGMGICRAMVFEPKWQMRHFSMLQSRNHDRHPLSGLLYIQKRPFFEIFFAIGGH